MSPLEKCLLKSCAHFSVELFGLLMVSCMTCLNILDIKCFSVASFANIFSYSVGCLFVLFMVFFAVQKPVSLIRSHLFLFLFVSFWDANLRKHWYDLCERMFKPRFINLLDALCSLWDFSSPTKD